MRALRRNKRLFYYSQYQQATMIYKDGMATGEYEVGRYTPVECYGNISAGSGDSQANLYGVQSSDFDKVIVLDDLSLPIDSNTVLWIDNADDVKEGNVVPYDYIVKKVAKSLNSVTIAVKKVNVE